MTAHCLHQPCDRPQGHHGSHGTATDLLTAIRAQGAPPRTWALPPEPGPEVLRLAPEPRYAGDNAVWLERDGTQWCIVMHGRRGEPLEWVRAYCAGGGRPLTDATAEHTQAERPTTREG